MQAISSPRLPGLNLSFLLCSTVQSCTWKLSFCSPTLTWPKHQSTTISNKEARKSVMQKDKYNWWRNRVVQPRPLAETQRPRAAGPRASANPPSQFPALLQATCGNWRADFLPQLSVHLHLWLSSLLFAPGVFLPIKLKYWDRHQHKLMLDRTRKGRFQRNKVTGLWARGEL